MHEHATVILGQYTIPLIGVHKEATQETCANCQATFHMSVMHLNESGQPQCPKCRAKTGAIHADLQRF